VCRSQVVGWMYAGIDAACVQISTVWCCRRLHTATTCKHQRASSVAVHVLCISLVSLDPGGPTNTCATLFTCHVQLYWGTTGDSNPAMHHRKQQAVLRT
jgi:hypothetical protein